MRLRRILHDDRWSKPAERQGRCLISQHEHCEGKGVAAGWLPGGGLPEQLVPAASALPVAYRCRLWNPTVIPIKRPAS